MKLFFTLAFLSVCTLAARPAYSFSFPVPASGTKTASDHKKVISIGADRPSGNVQLRFTAGKEGAALVTILDEAGKIVFQQVNQLTNHLNIIPIKNAAAFAEGSYTLRLVSNNKTYSTSFMVWK